MNKSAMNLMSTWTAPLLEKSYAKHVSRTDADRLLELFSTQNESGDWLDSHTVACWIFETNAPTEFQKLRSQSLLRNLSSQARAAKGPAKFLDVKIQSVDTGYGSTVFRPTYKISLM